MRSGLISVLVFHQSADMYGSDKVLLTLVRKLDRNKFRVIIMLPVKGPLTREFDDHGIEYHIVPLAIVSRDTFSIKGILGFLYDLFFSLKKLNKVLGDSGVDVVYSNTIAVFSGAVWSKLNGVDHVWHVHEIIDRPVIARKMFAWMLRLLSSKVVYNSKATLSNILKDQPMLKERSTVIWNGFDMPTSTIYNQSGDFLRVQLGVGCDDVLVVLVGRINRWKGQCLLVDAASSLWRRGQRNIHYLIVGSPPAGQDHFLEVLTACISRSPAKKFIHVLPFMSNVWSVWTACDIAVVPSTEPEPFGMVALEAMLARKPVIAANHGGISEIVEHEKTGLLVKPGNVHALADAISKLAGDASLSTKFGRNGLERSLSEFSEERYVSSVASVFQELYAVE